MRRVIFRAASLVAGLAVAVTATIASELPAGAASSCKISFDSYPVVSTGSYGARAKAAQCLLKAAGYDNRIRKSFSPLDAAQLKRFQAAHKLSATGTVNANTWTALLARGSKPVLRYADTGRSVRRLQRSLTASGRPVPVSGHFGPITRDAVKSVQSLQGWRATGVATTGVWLALQSGGGVKITVVKAVTKAPIPTAPESGKAATALAFARQQLGDRYVFGGSGPNTWDCSGLTMKAWQAAGVTLPHSAARQFRIGAKISKSDLKPGDLVFFYRGIRHVALYAGDGMVIHAPHPGARVSYIKLAYMPYMGARRLG
jgi:cell wall-associated NlpC family hydrolase